MSDHSRCVGDARKRLEQSLEIELANGREALEYLGRGPEAPIMDQPACRATMFGGQECGLREPHIHWAGPVMAEYPGSDPT